MSTKTFRAYKVYLLPEQYEIFKKLLKEVDQEGFSHWTREQIKTYIKRNKKSEDDGE